MTEPFIRGKQVVDQGGIGDIRIIKITNRDPKRPALDFISCSGGLFSDCNIHDFDMARFVSNANITEVFAMGTVLVDQKIADLGDIDTTILSMKLSNGALCIIDSSRETHYGYDQSLEVFGSKGNICVHNTCPTQVKLTNTEGVHSDKPHYSFVERYSEAYRDQFEHFFDAQLNDKSIPVSIKDIEQALLAARAAGQSYQPHKPIQL